MPRPKKPRRVVAAGVLLFRRQPQREFLLLKHPSRWDLPKGHGEAGETLEQTALREMNEETGIDPASVLLDPQFRFILRYPVRYREDPKRPFEKELTIFLGWLDDAIAPTQQITCTEHPDYAWHAWQPPHRIQTQTIDPLLAAAAKHIEQA
jgi:bis(5'-nucleosidyl)-tetraphosphatase